ncbi:MAG: hypothetical protein H5T97_06975, partial [Firmicutes bacterium]|nr:hypothetical protein [Bacillota bacterium]
YALRWQAAMADLCLKELLRDLVVQGCTVKLTVVPRYSVASRQWWTLEWSDPEAETGHMAYSVSAENAHLLCWRAARHMARMEERIRRGLPGSSA